MSLQNAAAIYDLLSITPGQAGPVCHVPRYNPSLSLPAATKGSSSVLGRPGAERGCPSLAGCICFFRCCHVFFPLKEHVVLYNEAQEDNYPTPPVPLEVMVFCDCLSWRVPELRVVGMPGSPPTPLEWAPPLYWANPTGAVYGLTQWAVVPPPDVEDQGHRAPSLLPSPPARVNGMWTYLAFRSRLRSRVAPGPWA